MPVGGRDLLAFEVHGEQVVELSNKPCRRWFPAQPREWVVVLMGPEERFPFHLQSLLFLEGVGV